MMNFRARYSEKLIFWGVYTLLNCGNNLKWTEDTSRNKVRGVSEIPSGVGEGFTFWPMVYMSIFHIAARFFAETTVITPLFFTSMSHSYLYQPYADES